MLLAALWPAVAAAAPASRTVVYVCGSDRITVRYVGVDNPGGAPRASLRLPNGRSVMLSQATSASGARYSDGTVTLWEHQGTALIETPGRSWSGCVPRPR